MNTSSFDDVDEGNIMEIEEDFDAPSSRKISNSIHDFSEIMSVGNNGRPSDRFSGVYNPRRKNLLTETNKENINKADTKLIDNVPRGRATEDKTKERHNLP